MSDMRYYVVVRGRDTGIFRSLDYCRDQVLGFPGAKFRGFEYLDEAEDYWRREGPPSDYEDDYSDDDDEMSQVYHHDYDSGSMGQRFYAVDRGHQIGIFTSYEDCKNLITGYSMLHFRRFYTYEEAAHYLEVRSRRCYAILKGRQTGVIRTWEECQELVYGFLHNSHRRFNSQRRAEEFFESERLSDDEYEHFDSNGSDYDNSSSTSQEDVGRPFYAVVRGRRIGVFSSMAYSKELVANYPDGHYEKFRSYADAQNFICEYDYLLPEVRYQGRIHTKPALRMDLRAYEGPPSQFRPPHSEPRSTPKSIYTDGACRGNGLNETGGAGYGVFYSLKSKFNALVPIKFDATNQRAELMGIRHALIDIANLLWGDDNWAAYDFEIVTDSKYGIQSVSEFSETWCQNGWITSTGEAVKNQDLLREMVKICNYISSSGVLLQWTHVLGHSGIPGNEFADALANEGAEILQYC